MEPGSVRERQRHETRRRLLEAAQALVAERGYSGTTVAQIAGAAGVTERTFFRHFESKTELFLSNWKEITGDMEEAMGGLPAVTPVFDVVVAGLREFAGGAQEIIRREAPAPMVVFAQTAPVLGMLETVLALEDVLASTIAWRLGLDAEQVEVRVVANASIGVLRATIRSYATGSRRRALPTAVEANLEPLRPLYRALLPDGSPVR